MKYPLILNIVQVFNVLIPVWAFFRWKKASLPQRIFIIQLIGVCIFDLSEHLMARNNIRNLWCVHISSLWECTMFLTVYYYWKRKKHVKRILQITGFFFVAFWITGRISFEPFFQFNGYTSSVSRIIEISVSVIILFDVSKDSLNSLREDARFWIASGTIIYSVGSLLLIAMFNTMLNATPELLKTIWTINWVLMITAYLFFIRGILCQTHKKDFITDLRHQPAQ